MKRKFEVRWSHESLRRVDNIIFYLEEHWTSKEIKSFLVALKQFEKLVSKYPEIYPVSDLKI